MLRRILAPLILPLLVWLGLFLLQERLALLPGAVFMALAWLPYAAFSLAAILGWYFRRSRVLFTVAFLAATLTCLSSPTPELMVLLTLLVPLNLTFMAFFEDRSLDSVSGLLGLAWLMSQLALGQWLLEPQNYAILEPYEHQLGWLVTGVSTLLLMGRYFKIRNPLEWGLVASFGGAVVALYAPLTVYEQRAMFLFCGVVLAVAVIRLSYGMAYIDELTELPGRRALNEEMKELGSRYSIAMLDVDHFKKFNDKHGHDVGDHVLRLVAARMMRVSGGGRPFRYGGEEFTVLFPGKEADDIIDALEALRESIARSPLVLRSTDRPRQKPKTPSPQKGPRKSVSVTISIGVASPEPGQTPQQVLKEADKALYRAKKKGRNQVCA